MPFPHTRASAEEAYADTVPKIINTSIFAAPARIDAMADFKKTGPSSSSTAVPEIPAKSVDAETLAPNSGAWSQEAWMGVCARIDGRASSTLSMSCLRIVRPSFLRQSDASEDVLDSVCNVVMYVCMYVCMCLFLCLRAVCVCPVHLAISRACDGLKAVIVSVVGYAARENERVKVCVHVRVCVCESLHQNTWVNSHLHAYEFVRARNRVLPCISVRTC
jgi:hypothetical protein